MYVVLLQGTQGRGGTRCRLQSWCSSPKYLYSKQDLPFEKTPQNKVRPVILTGGICLCVAQMALMKVFVPDSFFNTDVDVCILYSAHISICSTALSPFDICCHCYFVNETLSHWLQYAAMETLNFSLFVKFIADEQDFRQDLLNSQVLALIVFLQSGRHYQTFPSADFHP